MKKYEEWGEKYQHLKKVPKMKNIQKRTKLIKKFLKVPKMLNSTKYIKIFKNFKFGAKSLKMWKSNKIRHVNSRQGK